jgi:hypothetical protein
MLIFKPLSKRYINPSIHFVFGFNLLSSAYKSYNICKKKIQLHVVVFQAVKTKANIKIWIQINYTPSSAMLQAAS